MVWLKLLLFHWIDWAFDNYKITLDNPGATNPGTKSIIATYVRIMSNISMPTKVGYEL